MRGSDGASSRRGCDLTDIESTPLTAAMGLSRNPHFLRTMFAYEGGDPQNAVREFKSALEREPNHVESLFWLTICLIYVGRPERVRHTPNDSSRLIR